MKLIVISMWWICVAWVWGNCLPAQQHVFISVGPSPRIPTRTVSHSSSMPKQYPSAMLLQKATIGHASGVFFHLQLLHCQCSCVQIPWVASVMSWHCCILNPKTFILQLLLLYQMELIFERPIWSMKYNLFFIGIGGHLSFWFDPGWAH